MELLSRVNEAGGGGRRSMEQTELVLERGYRSRWGKTVLKVNRPTFLPSSVSISSFPYFILRREQLMRDVDKRREIRAIRSSSCGN